MRLQPFSVEITVTLEPSLSLAITALPVPAALRTLRRLPPADTSLTNSGAVVGAAGVSMGA